MSTRNKEEWLNKMLEQLLLLEDFSKEYDNSKIYYAIEMSIKLRVLLHSNNSSESLLSNFCSAYKINKPDFLNNTFFPTSMANEKSSKFVRSNMCGFDFTLEPKEPFMYPKPNLGKTGNIQYKAFNSWWKRVTAINLGDSKNTTLSRKDVVQLVCNKDGGAHIDSDLPQSLVFLMRNEGKPLTLVINGNVTKYVKLDELLYATIRQIAYETLNTLHPFVNKYTH